MKPKVLMVEDENIQIDIVLDSLNSKYDFYIAKTIQDAKGILRNVEVDILLLDVMLTDGDGFGLHRWINDKFLGNIVIIYITSMDSIDAVLQGFSLGANDYVIKPFDVNELNVRMEMHLSFEKNREYLSDENKNLVKKLKEKSHEINKVKVATMLAVTKLLDRKYGNTSSDLFRMRYLVRLIGEKLLEGASTNEHDAFIDNLCDAAALHDIGMIAIDDELLMKTEKLTSEEYEKIKQHTIYGCDAMDEVKETIGELDFIDIAKECIRYHHERWDGMGYPSGLEGNDIPLSSRIMALVDVYEALISKRSYRRAFSHQEAVEIINNTSGQFDPEIVSAFKGVEGELTKYDK